MPEFLLALLAASAAPAGGAKALPTVARVLARYAAVTHQEALARHSSITVRGVYEVPAKKLALATVLYARGGKALWKFALPDGRTFETGYDGKTAWDLDPAGRAKIRGENETRSVARDADFLYHLHVARYFRSFAVVGVATFAGRRCYRLEGITTWGQVNEHFYDTATGLLRGYAFDTSWRGGKGKATMTFSDYRDFGGVRLPVKTVSREGNDVSVRTVVAVSYDDVDDSTFALPEAVKKALEGKTAGR